MWDEIYHSRGVIIVLYKPKFCHIIFKTSRFQITSCHWYIQIQTASLIPLDEGGGCQDNPYTLLHTLKFFQKYWHKMLGKIWIYDPCRNMDYNPCRNMEVRSLQKYGRTILAKIWTYDPWRNMNAQSLQKYGLQSLQKYERPGRNMDLQSLQKHGRMILKEIAGLRSL